MSKTVFYASVGPELTLFDIDVDNAALIRRGALTLPANVQYVWLHPSRRWLYVASSNGGPGLAGDAHYLNALAIDGTTGALQPHGAPVALPSRPIHVSVDRDGAHLLTAYNAPSTVTVHRLGAGGEIGAAAPQPQGLDTGIYAHQVLAVPSNRAVLLVTRGNDSKPGKPEDPGALKTFAFHDGVLSNLASVAPGDGRGFGPRHLDFHPTSPWVFVSIERQNKLYVYRLDAEHGLTATPMFVKETLANPHPPARQAAGPIHVHPNGRFVYLTNRASETTAIDGRQVFAGGENNVAVFAIDQESGEPRLIQNADGSGIQLRTFAIDPSGRLLVAASITALPVREGGRIVTLPAGITLFRIGADGRLAFARKYDVDTGRHQQFWSGIVVLP